MNPPDLLPPKLNLRPDEVATLMQLSRRTVYRMIRDGRMPAFRHGPGPWRIPRDALHQILMAPPP